MIWSNLSNFRLGMKDFWLPTLVFAFIFFAMSSASGATSLLGEAESSEGWPIISRLAMIPFSMVFAFAWKWQEKYSPN